MTSPTGGAPGGGVAAVVLAAGGGTRFAGDGHKLLAPFRGRPLVAWAVEAAVAAGLDEVVVVGGAVDLTAVVEGVAGAQGASVTLLANPQWQDGQASSLGVAVRWCERRGYEAMVVGLGDQPLVPADAWRRVARADGTPLVAAAYGGRRRNPVRIARSAWPLLPVDGDEGARVLMRAHPELVSQVACEGDPADVDTIGDLHRWDE